MTTSADILARLDAKAVLIPIPPKGTEIRTPKKTYLTKGKDTDLKGWSKKTFAQTQTPAFQRRLALSSAIAVALGKQSEGVCSIDFDDDSALAEFIALNPSLKTSLTTAGKRGCNIWLKVTGDMPRTKILKRGDKPLGEWRSTGGYTIICG
ncbi:bifunctional DNA primase/polymerase, partial [bacterium]|nr:bifunctional DNA primase/polymerase [bacterium]